VKICIERFSLVKTREGIFKQLPIDANLVENEFNSLRLGSTFLTNNVNTFYDRLNMGKTIARIKNGRRKIEDQFGRIH